jgi:hypothetical protein
MDLMGAGDQHHNLWRAEEKASDEENSALSLTFTQEEFDKVLHD